MSAALDLLTEEYGRELLAYLSGAEESALVRAYEIGRRAIEDGLGVLDICTIHGTAWGVARETGADVDRAEGALAFLTETLAPFDMAQRGYTAMTGKLVETNEKLQQETLALHAVNRQLEDQILERKTAERLGREARAEAERANAAKSEFLSRMSHELRTPLNAILGFAQLLEMDDLEPGRRQSVEQIRVAGAHLLALIDETLQISRIEAGRLELAIERIPLVEVVADAVAMVEPMVTRADLVIEVETEGAEGITVSADRTRLRQVLLNLLSNAVKYNREGGSVAIACRSVVDGRVAVSVTDTGVGIAPERRGQLFEPFERLGAESSEIEGTGLGLAVSKRLIEAMGGTISLEDGPQGTTTFVVDLAVADGNQAESAETPIARAVTAPRSATGLVVYIEDDAANLRLVEAALATRPGVEFAFSREGRGGVELVRARPTDLVLLDLHLPDLPGVEVLRALKADPRTRHVPVVVLTADALGEGRERSLELGALASMTKPIDVPALLRIVDDVLASNEQPSG